MHLIKLSVGSATMDDLRRWQAHWGEMRPPLRHTTRHFPRRAAELLDGGSIYWVIARVVTARQRLLDIVEGARADGSRACDLVLDPVLVPVAGLFCKPFQGWRYLEGDAAPKDIEAASGADELPQALRQDLARLGLL